MEATNQGLVSEYTDPDSFVQRGWSMLKSQNSVTPGLKQRQPRTSGFICAYRATGTRHPDELGLALRAARERPLERPGGANDAAQCQARPRGALAF